MSDVPEGYKMSEVGVIPEEWEVKSLENIGLFRKGKNIPKKDLTSEGVPCVLYGEIYTKYNFTSKKLNSFIPHAIAQQSTAINKGDILFAGSGETAEEIGKCFTYLGDEKACAGGDINILSPFNDDSTFLGYLLNSPQVNKQKSNLGQGSSVVHIYSNSLKTILIPSPPLSEQQAIASALSDVDALITALEQLITKKRNIKQGAMQQLLTGKKRLSGFSGEWEVLNIDEIADVKGGKRLPEGKSLSNSETQHPYIRVADMYQGGVSLEKIKYVPDNVFPSIKSYLISKNDLFITVAGTLGIVGKIPPILNGANLTENADKLTNIKCNQDFLLYILMSSKFQNYVEAARTLGAQPKLALVRIQNFQTILPPLPEQIAIAQILSDMDTELESLEQKRDKYKALKQGMMQELLTGKRRLA